MTTADRASLFGAMKRERGSCLVIGLVLDRWLAQNTHVDPSEARQAALMIAKAPFPSVDGNPPRYRLRPFFDARFHEGTAP